MVFCGFGRSGERFGSAAHIHAHGRACVRDTTPIYPSMSFHPSIFIYSIIHNYMQSLGNIGS